MSGTMTLTEFIKARLDEDEAVARAAIDPERPGTHWHWWRADEQDRPAIPDEDTGGDYMEDDGLWLCTVEVFPTTSVVGPLPGVIISYAEEVKAAPAFHIARHDPSRVLNQVDAHRMLVEDHSGRHVCEDNMAGTVWDEKTEDIVEDPCRVLRIIGSIYADHPDYRTEWQVQG